MALTDPGIGRQVICGPGPQAPMVTLHEAVNEGDLLSYSSGWHLADANTASLKHPQLVALKSGAIGDLCPVAVVCTVTGYSGGTAGGLIYASEAATGHVTDTPHDTNGDSNTVIGVLLDATTIQFNLTGVQVVHA